MLSISKDFLFIHIPKTGGNSIQNLLIKYSEDEIFIPFKHQDGIQRFNVKSSINPILRKHSTISDYKKYLSSTVYDNLYKFTTVRNPWDRIVSFYFSPHKAIDEFDRNEFIKIISQVKPIFYYTHELSLIDKLKNSIGLLDQTNSQSAIDFYLRFENLQYDFDLVCKKIGVETQQLPKVNSSKRKHYSEYYDNHLKDMVFKKFKEEINLFNYQF